ncbi:MAG: DinB family protein [Actinomycetales bacterium]|nr:DinB family protein [Actinomycetales bacterium]
MTPAPIGPAFSSWSHLNSQLRDCIEALTPVELAWSAGPGRWPLWAVVGHAACQRVFWLCDFAGEPGASATPFPNAAWNCPGDDDLEHPLDARALVHALTSTFAIVEGALGRWSLEDLAEELHQPTWGEDWTHTRGSVIQRVHMHDVWHASEANEILTGNGLPGFDLWNGPAHG